MKKLIFSLLLSCEIMRAAIVPISTLPHIPSPTNGMIFLLAIPGQTNGWISVGELMTFVGTNSTVGSLLFANTNNQLTIAASTYFADYFTSNQEFLNIMATNTFVQSNFWQSAQTQGKVTNSLVWPSSVITVQNGFTLYTTFSNISFTTIQPLVNPSGWYTNGLLHQTVVITNGASTNILVTWLAAGRKINTTTNVLTVTNGALGYFEIDFLQGIYTNYKMYNQD